MSDDFDIADILDEFEFNDDGHEESLDMDNQYLNKNYFIDKKDLFQNQDSILNSNEFKFKIDSKLLKLQKNNSSRNKFNFIQISNELPSALPTFIFHKEHVEKSFLFK